MYSLFRAGSWLRHLVFALPFVGAALSAELPPTAQVVGLSRPVPQGFALHPNQRVLATLLDNGVALSDLKTLAVIRKLGIDEPPSSAVVFSADGALVAIGHEQGVVSVWRMDGRRVTWFKGHIDRVMALAFSPDGQWLASGGYDGTVQVWSTASWNRVATMDGVTDSQPQSGYYYYQAVLGLGFSADSRFLYSLETVYDGESRQSPATRVLSAWEAGSWLETGRLTRRLKGMDFNGYANPLDAPLGISNWGNPLIFVAGDDGFGDPGEVVPPTLDKLRRMVPNGCFPAIGDPDGFPPSDTWPTALAVHPAKGWLAAGFLEGRRFQFHPGIALIPLGAGATQRNWPTSKQNIQLAFDGHDHLYALSADGRLSAWDLGSLKTLKPIKTKMPVRTHAACRPTNEAPTAQMVAPAARKTLVQLARWSLDPVLRKDLLFNQWHDYAPRFDLVGEKLGLWGPQSRIYFETRTGDVIERDPVLNEGETLIPNRRDSRLLVARSDALLSIDPQSGKRRNLDIKPGWELTDATIADDYIATAWANKSVQYPYPFEFHVLPAKGGKVRVIRPVLPPAIKNLGFIGNDERSLPLSFLITADGRWLLYTLEKDGQSTWWMLLDTRTGKSRPLTKPLQAFEGTRLLLPDARWMGLAVFDAATGQIEARMRRHVNRLPSDAKHMPYKQMALNGAISSSEQYAVSGALDGSIKVWDVTKRMEIASEPGPTGITNAPIALGFDRQDETRFFSLHWDGTFTLWQIQEVTQ